MRREQDTPPYQPLQPRISDRALVESVLGSNHGILARIKPLDPRKGKELMETASLTRMQRPVNDNRTIGRQIASICPRPVEPLTARTYEDQVKEIFQREFERSNLSLEDLTKYRIRAALRLVRTLGRILGIVEEGESLYQAGMRYSSQEKSLWMEKKSPNQGAGHEINAIFGDLWRYQESHNLPIGLGLLPPDPPKHSFTPKGNYIPDHDKEIQSFVKVLQVISFRNKIDYGTIEEPEAGRWGLAGLLDPVMVRMAWPSPEALLVAEEQILEDLLESNIVRSVRKTEKYAREKYGLSYEEVSDAVGCLVDSLPARYASTLESDKALMVRRLENLIEKAQDNLDLRGELAALKQLCLVQGITQAETNDEFKSLVNIISEVARDRPPLQIIDVVASSEGPINPD